MPIRVTCSCGQSLSVPDAMAGKSGKCPKCAGIIRIPATSTNAATSSTGSQATGSQATGSQAGKTEKPPEKRPSPASLSSPATGGALDRLFAEAGLDKKKGPECPACKSPIDPTASICVKCGFNLATGQKMKGVAVEVAGDPAQFVNRQLNEAHLSLKKETEADEKAKFTGAPWWVSLAVVLGLMSVIAFGIILVEGRGMDSEGESLAAPMTTMKGRIQHLPIPNALMAVGWLVSSIVLMMAWIATTAAAFRDKVAQGFLCLIIPFFVHYYSFNKRSIMKSTMTILWGWSVVWIALAIGMFTTGTFVHLFLYTPKKTVATLSITGTPICNWDELR